MLNIPTRKAIHSILSAFALMAVVVPTAGCKQATAVAVTEADKPALSTEFSKLYVPSELSVSTAVKNYERQFMRGIEANPQALAMEKQKPGITKFSMDAGRVEMEKAITALIPNVQKKLADFMSKEFTAQELAEINAFYKTDSAQALLKATSENMNTDAIADKEIANLEAGVETPAINKDDVMNVTQEAVMKSIKPEMMSDIMKFMTSSTGQKFQQKTGGIAEIVTSGMNNDMMEQGPKIQAAVMKAAESYTGK
jgi:hypothetical protein